ncbi:Uncharacterised protein [Propionibacterium australiense]|nr:Uncharacterised protein [Propionibacterium australiense]
MSFAESTTKVSHPRQGAFGTSSYQRVKRAVIERPEAGNTRPERHLE